MAKNKPAPNRDINQNAETSSTKQLLRKHSKTGAFAILLLLGAFATLFIFSTPRNPQDADGSDKSDLSLQVSIPGEIDFCGETVPLDDPEVKERFDREFMLNVYDFATMSMIIRRLNRWEKPMLEILRKEGVPEDFIYLMVAESGVRNATSVAGAQGFWQFMPTTGREYGLKQTPFIDERNHPIKSTHAACRYLKSSYATYGNWTLSAASYNMGSGALSYNMKHQGQSNYYDLLLNLETSRYIFRILAYKYILSKPEVYGYHIPFAERYVPHSTRVVRVDRTIDLVRFASEQGTTLKVLRWLNPWLKSTELPTHHGQHWDVLVPLDKPIVHKPSPPTEAPLPNDIPQN